MQLIRDRRFYISLAALAIPLALQDLIRFGTNLLDNIMVGALSEVEISAVSLAGQAFFLFALLVFGLSSGGTVLVAQYHGKGDMRAVNKVVNITMMYSLCASVLFTLVILLAPDAIMRIFTPDPAVIKSGVEYLRIIGYIYPFYAVSSVCGIMLRSVRITKPTLLINFIGFLINLALNWILIFGNLGMPAMGVRGAALATVIARVVECFLSLYILRYGKNPLQFRFSGLLSLSRTLQKDYFRYSMPVTINEFAWALGTVGMNIVLGHMGTEIMSAASITSSVQTFVSVLFFALSSATCILVGNAMGKGDVTRAKQIAHTLLLLSIASGLLVAGTLFAMRGPIIGLYNIGAATVRYAYSFLGLTAILLMFESVGLNVIVGVLRGGGDTKFAMVIDVLSVWLVALPLGVLLAFGVQAPALLIYLGLRSDYIIRCVACLFRMRGTRWMRNVTRENV